MYTKLYFILALVLVFGLRVSVSAQTCTALGQNPSTAFPVCGTTTFSQSSVPICGIRAIPVPCFDGALYADKNPFWYKFTCYAAGTLGFVITPMVLSDDYDWQLFDITGRNPDDVYSDPSLFVAANWSFMSGTTGASSAGSSLIYCAADPTTFSQMPLLIVGHQYLLLISHFTNTQSGYQLSFGGGTASITDPNLPIIQSATPNCDGSRIVVRFNKPLRCSSLTGTGTEFSVLPAGTIISAIGHGCANSFTMDSVTLTLNGGLAAGNYTLNAQLGSDGNTLTDNCGNNIAVGNSVPFVIPPPPPLPMGTVGVLGCGPSSVTITFPDPIKCNSIAINGSDFNVTGPSSVTIMSAAATCNPNGETNSVTVTFSGPVVTGGIYQLQVQTGTDGNTLLGNCNSPVPSGSSTTFNVAVQPPLPMGTITSPGCSPSSLTLTFPDNILCSSIAVNGSDFLITGPGTVAIASASGSCNTNGETNTITIQLVNPINASGSYQLQVKTGTDGNTLFGTCYRQVTAGANVNFNIPASPPAMMFSIPLLACTPTSMRIIMDQPVQCSSLTADGTDFRITGPGPINIISATGTCTNGMTTTIDLQFSAPITQSGTYQLQLKVGSDGNTLLNNCNRPSLSSSLLFGVSDTVSARFSYLATIDCNTNAYEFTHPGGNNINSWSWTVNGNPVGNQQTLSQSFPAGSQQVVQLTVSNGRCSNTWSETFVLDANIIVDFTIPDFICPGDSVVIRNLTSGVVNTWSWNFDNGQTSNLEHPNAQFYPNTGSEVFYNISLTATIPNGCSTTKTKRLRVLPTCMIAVPSAFTPDNDGLNDYLYPLNAFHVDQLDFKVYNRWGEMIFSTNDWQRKWDGRIKGILQPTGVFIWTLRYKDRSSGKIINLKGTTLLIRR